MSGVPIAIDGKPLRNEAGLGGFFPKVEQKITVKLRGNEQKDLLTTIFLLIPVWTAAKVIPWS
jgi:hypothetical protein